MSNKRSSSRAAADDARRKDIYQLLSLLFREEPRQEFLERLARQGAFRHLQEAGYFNRIEFDKIDLKRWSEELVLEYTRIFLGPGPHIAPYGSVHFTEGGLLWGEVTVKIKQFIEHHGLTYRPDYTDLPDHITILFEFMALILQEKTKLRERGRKKDLEHCTQVEKTFFSEFIAPWVPGFCEKIRQFTANEFYREVSRLTSDFVESELIRLGPHLD